MHYYKDGYFERIELIGTRIESDLRCNVAWIKAYDPRRRPIDRRLRKIKRIKIPFHSYFAYQSRYRMV